MRWVRDADGSPPHVHQVAHLVRCFDRPGAHLRRLRHRKLGASMTAMTATMAIEIADNWEQMAATEADSSPERRAALRECADLVRMVTALDGSGLPPQPEHRTKGWVMVPIRPTRAMWAVAGNAIVKEPRIGLAHDVVTKLVWEAMLSALPEVVAFRKDAK